MKSKQEAHEKIREYSFGEITDFFSLEFFSYNFGYQIFFMQQEAASGWMEAN